MTYSRRVTTADALKAEARALSRSAKKAGAKGKLKKLGAIAEARGALSEAIYPTGTPVWERSGDVVDRLIASATPAKADDKTRAEIAQAVVDGYALGEMRAEPIIARYTSAGDEARAFALEELATKYALRDAARERADEIKQELAGSDDDGDDYADVAAAIANGVERRVPDAGGVRNDGARLAYSGAVNGLVGPPESGKTLVAIAQACDELKAGGRVLHIDADHNGLSATLAHYLAASIEPDVLGDRSRFRYVDVRSAEHVRRVVADAAEWLPTFVPVDSVGELVPLFGGDSNSNDDYRRIHREILTPLARLGAAVLVLDHVTKEESRGGYAIGAGAKKAAIDGSYLQVQAVEPFTPGVGGAAALKILKDRHGGLRAASPVGKSPTAAVFRLDSRSDVSTWEFWRTRDSDGGDEQAEADIAYVLALEPFPTSRSKLQAALKAAQGAGWGNDRAHAALEGARLRRNDSSPFVTTH